MTPGHSALRRQEDETNLPLASAPPGMPGAHPLQYFGLGDVNGNISPNIITNFKSSTSEYTKTCHFEITKQEIFWGGGTPSPRTSHPLWHFVPPILNSRCRHWHCSRLHKLQCILLQWSAPRTALDTFGRILCTRVNKPYTP